MCVAILFAESYALALESTASRGKGSDRGRGEPGRWVYRYGIDVERGPTVNRPRPAAIATDEPKAAVMVSYNAPHFSSSRS